MSTDVLIAGIARLLPPAAAYHSRAAAEERRGVLRARRHGRMEGTGGYYTCESSTHFKTCKISERM